MVHADRPAQAASSKQPWQSDTLRARKGSRAEILARRSSSVVGSRGR